MRSLTLSLPIYWTEGVRKPKTHLCGMNWFRNAIHFKQNAMKKDFTELVVRQLPEISIPFSGFIVHYSIYYKSPVCDPSNIIALIEKFTLDALKLHGAIIDDNVKYHKSSSWGVIEQDKENPRCEITIKELK